MKRVMVLTALVLSSCLLVIGQTQNWSEVEKVFEKKGTVKGDAFKIAFPRTDVHVTVDSVTIESGLALTSWIGFKQMNDHSMMMGDLVLLEHEVDPVLKKLVASGIEVTALHNHLLGESPKVMYLHFGGSGDATQLAQKMKEVLSRTGTPIGPQPLQRAEQVVEIDWSTVETQLGHTGQHKGPLIQFSIPRAETITEHGAEIPALLGMATAINIQKAGEKAATTGDFVLLADEVNPVVKALTEHGIAVTAIHNHMLYDSPRLFMVHFWGYDQPENLARGLKAALDKTNSTLKK
ncbi:MAG: DUF1259 domain-containing protein [Ignavibacteria bacterium]|nr:DUF1259 domain-containing protein [Ignavibacteria bacterium]MBI3766182.1 DUF1259 domain-containing protein [Ignavibacteriales bacterium]